MFDRSPVFVPGRVHISRPLVVHAIPKLSIHLLLGFLFRRVFRLRLATNFALSPNTFIVI